jgi:AAA15 family ATPase/GTPase
MLIQFTFSNFRSFPNETTLSMVAEKLKSQDKALDENNVFAVDDKLSLLTSAAIYGPNASGKSNVIKALEFMRAQVLRVSEGTKSTLSPFLLSRTATKEPSQFEIHFVANQIRFQYGFAMTSEQVISEWLYFFPSGSKRLVYKRGEEFKFGKDFRYLRGYTPLVRPDYLFLAVLALDTSADEYDVIAICIEWFYSLTIVLNLLNPEPAEFARHSLEGGGSFEALKSLVKRLDVGISDLWAVAKKKLPSDTSAPSRRLTPPTGPFALLSDAFRSDEQLQIMTSHSLFGSTDEPEGEIEFDLEADESEGTRKLLALASLVLSTLGTGEISLGRLQTGSVLVIDELDARLHTTLTREIVGLFNDPQSNPNHAQLIFTAHDTNLLDNQFLRRDQIWFVDKDRRGASQLYSLAEFKGVRNDKDFELGYIQGRYGAQPFIHALRETVVSYGSKKKE